MPPGPWSRLLGQHAYAADALVDNLGGVASARPGRLPGRRPRQDRVCSASTGACPSVLRLCATPPCSIPVVRDPAVLGPVEVTTPVPWSAPVTCTQVWLWREEESVAARRNTAAAVRSYGSAEDRGGSWLRQCGPRSSPHDPASEAGWGGALAREGREGKV